MKIKMIVLVMCQLFELFGCENTLIPFSAMLRDFDYQFVDSYFFIKQGKSVLSYV